MSSILNQLESFWTYQTPISFLAGVGAYYLYCRATHKGLYNDRKDDVQEDR